jgi:murein DD-endopeptidase MepM/ murein hydrolase activator NlpD
MKLADDGSLTTVPDPAENREFHTYGAEILAVADGTVVGILDGVPENSPYSREMPIPMTRKNMPGNHIILDIGSQRFAFYAHLQPGSLLVEVGDFVEKGKPIALLGNSGRSDAPHLHFHIAGSADLYAADGRSFVFEAFDWIGSRDLLEMVNNSDATWNPGTVPPRSRIKEIPKSDSVIRFQD